jgi:hypothetical protein
MRTTISFDHDIVDALKVYARQRDLALGKAVSELVRRGLRAPLQTRLRNDLHVVDLPPGSPAISAEAIRKLE